MTAPWRQRTGWPSTVASTSTSAPARSTNGARMKTARNGSAVEVVERRGRPRRSRPGGRRRCGARRCRRRRSSAGRAGRRGSRRRAGSSRRRCRASGSPSAQPLGQRVEQPGGLEQHRHRRGLAARAAPGRRPRRARRGCGPRAAQRRGRAGTRRARRRRPAGRGRRPSPGGLAENMVRRCYGARTGGLPAAVGEGGVERVDLEARHGRRRARGTPWR